MKTTLASEKLDVSKDAATMREPSAEDEGYVTCPRDQRQRRRWWGLDDGPGEYTTTTVALKEEDEHKDYKNYNGCVGGG